MKMHYYRCPKCNRPSANPTSPPPERLTHCWGSSFKGARERWCDGKPVHTHTEKTVGTQLCLGSNLPRETDEAGFTNPWCPICTHLIGISAWRDGDGPQPPRLNIHGDPVTTTHPANTPLAPRILRSPPVLSYRRKETTRD